MYVQIYTNEYSMIYRNWNLTFSAMEQNLKKKSLGLDLKA
jgi:hypothetical protein